PYLAHYVTMDGEYLYSLPTIMPGDEAGAAGFDSAYVFEFMEPAEYTGTVTWSDGSEHEITVELMRDSRTGMYYMGNIKRRIAVADCWEVLYNKGHVVLEASKDNTDWDTATLISMYNYCRAWDYYDAIGWRGADGMETPILVLKDFCYKDHTPVDNAAYAGKYYGWQMFLSSSGNDLWQCLDVLAHEFTHCVTGSVMTYNAYKNDFGAINEAMSDIQGNICEMLNNDTEDTTWELGEHSSTPVRNMSDPHKYSQPEYTWDLYYKPHVKEPTEINDRGGVHSNSSLLNRLAYLLCAEGGMTLEDARAFWFAVDCAMVPGTDHAQLSELMPWVMKLLGMDNHLEALDAAIDAVKLRSDDMPESFGPNRTLVELTLPDQEQFTDGNWGMVVLSVNLEGLMQRLEDIAMGNGEYAAALDELNALIAEAEAQIEKKKEPGLLDQLLDAMFPSKEAEPEPEPEPEAPGEETEKKLDVSWLKRYFGDVVFFDNGAAGQDGRTVRMVSRTGDTIPVLYNLKMKSFKLMPVSGALAVYTLGRWYDLGGFIQQVMGERLGKTFGEKVDQNFIGDLFEKALPAISNPAQLRALLLTRITEGEVCVVPAEGLENVTILEGEIIDAIYDAIMDSTEDQPAA
ncbi:MAG: M4 family metallopeptidase, partial [bacterium]